MPDASRRVDPDAFYGSGPADPRPSGHLAQAEFFGSDPPPDPGRDALVRRLVRDPVRFGGLLAFFGFWSVFVSQAWLLHQIVLVAPIFEEFFKVGIALVLVGLLRVRPTGLRFAVALLPGAGFGFLEHALTYFDEPREVMVIRMLFHAGSTGLGVAVWSALEPLRDVRVRWGTTIPSTLFHYANNVGAVILGIAHISGLTVEAAGTIMSASVTTLLWIAAFAVVSFPDAIRARVRRRFPDPARTTFSLAGATPGAGAGPTPGGAEPEAQAEREAP